MPSRTKETASITRKRRLQTAADDKIIFRLGRTSGATLFIFFPGGEEGTLVPPCRQNIAVTVTRESGEAKFATRLKLTYEYYVTSAAATTSFNDNYGKIVIYATGQ